MKTSLSTVVLAAAFVLGCDLDPGSIGDETQGDAETKGDSGGDGCGDCAAGLQCVLPPGDCGAGPEAGTCQSVPDACNLIYAPVCGCDGVTYGNECEAEIAGVGILHDGECGGSTSTSTSGGDPSGPTDTSDSGDTDGSDTDGGTSGDGTGGDTGSGMQCDGFPGFPCPEGEFCYHEPGVCVTVADALGECRTIPEGCILLLDPVCGCDGVTYGNECDAHSQGVNVASEAECDADGAALCTDTGGAWMVTSCGHYNCGTPPPCAAVIPGCDCGPTANFVDGVGCMADAACP